MSDYLRRRACPRVARSSSPVLDGHDRQIALAGPALPLDRRTLEKAQRRIGTQRKVELLVEPDGEVGFKRGHRDASCLGGIHSILWRTTSERPAWHGEPMPQRRE